MACTDSLLSEHNTCAPSEWSYAKYLTEKEAEQIRERFRTLPLKPGCQVMWCGVPREWVQRRADENGMQTLTTAMGPLMMTRHPTCAKRHKTPAEWAGYVKGASGLFAYHLPKGCVVTVLCRPPPQKLNPEGLSTYQKIEEPFLKGLFGGAAVSRIDMVHPTVEGAETYRYQVWPIDETDQWIRRYGSNPLKKHVGKRTKRYTSLVLSVSITPTKELKTR
jgi:hypothetical protein